MLNNFKRYLYEMTHPAIGEVWQLHRVTDEISEDVSERTYEITPDRLIALMESYQQKGYKFISVVQLQEMINRGVYNKKFIVVTLDDGYEDNYDVAYPIFKKYNVPFCIFVTKEYVRNGRKPYSFLSERKVEELDNDPLCTIGIHTASHQRLNHLNQEEQEREIQECKQWLEGLLQAPVPYFAYPYGAYNADTIRVAKESGVELAFAAWGGPIRNAQKIDKYQVPRVLITEMDKK